MSKTIKNIKGEKRLVPVLRFKEFDREWKKDVVKTRIDSIDSGWSPQCEVYPASNEEWGVLKTTSVVWEGFNQNANKKLPEILQPRPNLQVVKEDILITRAGPTSRVGVTVYVYEVRSKLMLSDKLIRLKVNENSSSKFLSISLGNREAQKQLVRKSSGLAESQTNISQKIILNTKLFFPSLPEQQKIASFLSAVDEKIQQLSKKKVLLEAYKKGVMQQLFSGVLRFRDEDGEGFPDWEEWKFSDLYGFHSTNSLSRAKLNYNVGSVYNIHYGDIHTKFKTAFKLNEEYIPFVSSDVDLSKIKKDSYCKNGDLVMADASEDYDDIGKTIELMDLDDKNVLAGLHTFLARPITSETSIGFFSFLLKSWNIRKQIMVIAQGTKVLSLSTSRVGNLKLKLPAVEEQQKIASYLSSIDTKIESVGNQIVRTQSFKKGLLQQMFV